MPKKPTLFERVERARRDVQDLYIEAIRDEPLMETHKHLLAALRSLASASDEHLPQPPKKRRAATTETTPDPRTADDPTAPSPRNDRPPDRAIVI